MAFENDENGVSDRNRFWYGSWLAVDITPTPIFKKLILKRSRKLITTEKKY